MTPISRTDSAHDLGYPKTPDSRGTARVYHLRRPYYLGPFESPQSYVMFGLWKQRLLETQEASETKDLRPFVDSVLSRSEEPAVATRRKVFPGAAIAAACLIAATLIGVAIGTNFPSTNSPVAVDGFTLTADEAEFIRGMRLTRDRLTQAVSDRSAGTYDMMQELKEQGPKHGRWHIAKKDL